MATKAANKRLSKEYVAMQKEPPPFIWAVPDEKNILTWNFLIRGPSDSPFAGGEYHGVLLFPPEYPFKPPGIKMYTPSGRFQPDRKICFSMSDFHPGSWNPAWSVATILTGLLSFMLSDELTTGSLTSSDAHKRTFAARSHAWNLMQHRFKEAFPDYCTPLPRDVPNMGQSQQAKADTTSAELVTPIVSVSQVSSSDATGSSAAAQPALANGTTLPLVPKSSARTPGGNHGDNRNAATGWVTTWKNLLVEQWHLWGLLALAVLVSKFSSST